MFSNVLIFFASIIIILPIGIVLNARSPTLGSVCGVFWCCGMCWSFLIVYIMGMIWRFGEAGKFATSDEATTGEASDLY